MAESRPKERCLIDKNERDTAWLSAEWEEIARDEKRAVDDGYQVAGDLKGTLIRVEGGELLIGEKVGESAYAVVHAAQWKENDEKESEMKERRSKKLVVKRTLCLTLGDAERNVEAEVYQRAGCHPNIVRLDALFLSKVYV